MKCLIVLSLFSACALGQSLEEKYREKISKPFVTKVPWATSFDEASATAKKRGKLLLGYFTRSYAP